MLTFQANTVSAEYDENEVLIIGFADLQADEEPNHYFMIQHSEEYDEQDMESGLDTYYIERDGQGYSTYGGIQKIGLSSRQIMVELNEVGQKRLEVPGLIIHFNLTDEGYSHLQQQFRKVFDEQILKIE